MLLMCVAVVVALCSPLMQGFFVVCYRLISLPLLACCCFPDGRALHVHSLPIKKAFLRDVIDTFTCSD